VQDTRGALNGSELAVDTVGILVVDAYSHSREGLTASLRVGGYRVESAAGSWEAIHKAKDGHFGLAVIDLDLPPAHGIRMSGWDLARIIRAFHPGAAVILLTTEWSPDLRSQADGLHRARVMEKPIHPGELRALVRAFQSDRGTAVDDFEQQTRDAR